MKIADGIKSLFDSRKPMRSLSSSVVKHDQFDDGVLHDISERAHKFRETLDNAPPVYPTVDIPQRPEFDSDEAHKAAVDEAIERQARADELAENYTGWRHDVSDTFRAYHTWREPTVKDSSEIRPSREIGRRVMQSLAYSDAFSQARPYTRHSATEAALATMAFTETLRSQLETTFADQMRASQEASEQEDAVDDAERLLDNLRAKAQEQHDQTGQIDEDLAGQVRDGIEKVKRAREDLQGTVDVIEQTGFPGITQAVEAAAEKADEAAGALVGLPGTGAGNATAISPDQAFELARKWRENPTMRRIAELAGRLRRDMRFARSNRVQGGREEPVDIEFGNHIPDVLPHEMMLADDPDLELEWLRRFMERSLMQTEYVGTERVGRGPVIVGVDGSGSMNADMGGATRNEWARSVALSLVAIAHAEKRDSAVIEYSHGGQVKTWFFPAAKPIDPHAVAECAGHFFRGGTDTTLLLREASAIIDRSHAFKKADLILVSDGEDQWGDDDRQVMASYKARGVRVQVIGVGHYLTPYLLKVADQATTIHDLAAGREAAVELASHLT